MTVLAELGDLTRFDSPRELMSFLGRVPSEHSSGGRRRRGGITKTGNGHVRRVLVEAAWSDRFPARKTAHPRRKAQAAAPAVQAIAWAAQKRLCARYWHLYHAGKAKCQGPPRGGPRAGGVHLGGGLRGDGPASHHARIGLSDEPELSTLAHRPARVAGTRGRGQGVESSAPSSAGASLHRVFAQLQGTESSGLESGRGRPVRRILGGTPRGPLQAERPTPVDRGRSATK